MCNGTPEMFISIAFPCMCKPFLQPPELISLRRLFVFGDLYPEMKSVFVNLLILYQFQQFHLF
jgi:hypothetical protein